jgi:hypothetical protein
MKTELGKNFRALREHIELPLTIVPLGQITDTMLKLEAPMIYDL